MIKERQGGFGVVEGLLIVGVVVVVGLVGWRVYEASQQKVNTQQSVETPQVETPQTYAVKFPELGVQMVVGERIKDITTSLDSQYDSTVTLSLSTQGLTQRDAYCAATAGPLGRLHKVEGRYPENPTVDNSRGVLVKQFETYYIGMNNPQAACSEDDATLQYAESLRREFVDSLKTITEIESR